MIATDLQVVSDKFKNGSSDTAFFVAKAENSVPLGIIHLQAGTDYDNSVIAQNARAREVYQRFGFGEDIMKYVKELR